MAYIQHLLFANNASALLASPLAATGSGSTTAVLQTGAGALFPNPGAGQAFVLTLVSQNNPTVNEVCLCTARSGDTLTIVRAQEGTTAASWSIGDGVNMFPTAGTMAQFQQPPFRTSLTAAFNLYVNSVTGSDSNSGTSQTSALLTVQRAIDVARELYDTQGNTITINVALTQSGSNTFNESLQVNGPLLGGGLLAIQAFVPDIGGSVPPVINGGAGNALTVTEGGFVAIGQNSVAFMWESTESVFYAENGGEITLYLAGSPQGSPSAMIQAANLGRVYLAGTILLNGTSSGYGIIAANGGLVDIAPSIEIVCPAQAFTEAVVAAINGGIVNFASPVATFVNAGVTGVRYSASNNGVIDTNGAGSTYIPGSSAGTTANGGQYV